MKNIFKQKNSGFTLVETLVAISIFSISILGLMSILSSGISNTTYAKQKIIASYLAQEGIEYIRNMRDTFVLYGSNGWTNFNTYLTKAASLCQNANGCYSGDLSSADFSNPNQPMKNLSLTTCGAGTCPSLLYDSSTGKYSYASGTSSGFTRQIKVIQVGANETKITSTVFWTQGSGSYNATFSESLFNWLD